MASIDRCTLTPWTPANPFPSLSSALPSSHFPLTSAVDFAAIAAVLDVHPREGLPIDDEHDWVLAFEIIFNVDVSCVAGLLAGVLDRDQDGKVTFLEWHHFARRWRESGNCLVDFVSGDAQEKADLFVRQKGTTEAPA